MGTKRTKKYLIKTISEDGLMKDPVNRWNGTTFNQWGYDSEDEAWDAVEAFASISWDGSGYKSDFSYIVICEWTVSHEND